MVLEATYLCVDNSDYMRNGDFAPSRMEAQQDAVNLLAGAKTQVRAALRSAAAPLWQLPCPALRAAEEKKAGHCPALFPALFPFAMATVGLSWSGSSSV